MRIVADGHVHLYPCYDLSVALTTLHAGLVRHDPDAVHVGFLAERHDCDYFQLLAGNKAVPGVKALAVPQQSVLQLSAGTHATSMYLFAGRQIITREGLEILSLTTDARIPDGLPAGQVVDYILAEKALPVVSWAPGKWFFARKKVVKKLLERYEPATLLLGDSSLRPPVWSEPLLMRQARGRGFSVIAGSDPLPYSGEEKQLGRYAASIEGAFDHRRPVDSIRALIRNAGARISILGLRSPLTEVLSRIYHHHQSKRK